MNRSDTELIRQLMGLGLTELEARAYIALLVHGTSTAYHLAQKIQKPTANVYKAVRSLAAKGGIATQPGKKRLLSAIPPPEFLAHLQQSHNELISGVATGLASIRPQTEEHQLYTLENMQAVLERARSMLAAATSVVVIDAFPRMLASLGEDLRSAVQRRVQVYTVAYAPVLLPGANVVMAGDAERILSKWNCELLILVADGKEVLLALCQRDLDGVIHATWSNSLFLACVQHAGLMREHFFHQIQSLLASDAVKPSELKRLVKEHPTFLNLPVPGREALNTLIGSQSNP